MNKLFTTISTPGRSCGDGSPILDHEEGEYIFPSKEDVWLNFCHIEVDEKHKRIWILRPCAIALDESLFNNEQSCCWDVDFAQKHVTMIISCLAVRHVVKMSERIRAPVPIPIDKG
jgi:hypothetical protein